MSALDDAEKRLEMERQRAIQKKNEEKAKQEQAKRMAQRKSDGWLFK